MSISIWFFAVALLTSFQEQVSAQMLSPYGSAPIPYINNEDDDLGLLLTILLLGRNRNNCGGCKCCNCCNCRSGQNIPIPFPIPIPTYNPILNRGFPNVDYSDCDNETEEVIIDIVKSDED